MKIALVHSRVDPAGRNIQDRIDAIIDQGLAPPQAHEFVFVETADRLIYAEHVDRNTGADVLFFLSRHASARPAPVLTVHVSGNLFEAALGGEQGVLPPAATEWMHALIRELSARAPAGYRVSYESTHHGPTDLSIPSLFVEIGSTEKEWNDPAAAEAVAMSVLSVRPAEVIRLVGFGGTHYAQRQTDITINSRGAFGHIAPAREVPRLVLPLIQAMKSQTRAMAAYIDRKSLATGDLARLEGLIQNAGLVVLRESDLALLGDLDWEAYLSIRHMARTLHPAAVVHLHRVSDDLKYPVFFETNAELLDEALKADQAAFMAGLSELPIVHISTPKTAILPVFITGRVEQAHVLHDLITLSVKTISHKETIKIEGDLLSISKYRFDPVKARELGVTEGPLCGALMTGREVRVGDRIITPAMVRKTREKVIRIPGLENVRHEVNR